MLIPGASLFIQTARGDIGGATKVVANWLRDVFDYVPDPLRPDGLMDEWPTRAEVEAKLAANNGRLPGDCDDHAFAAGLALADLGVRARVVLCYIETGGYHAVCEDELGYVIDNRYPGRVLTWPELERIGYRRDRMSGYFAFGETTWHLVDGGSPRPPA